MNTDIISDSGFDSDKSLKWGVNVMPKAVAGETLGGVTISTMRIIISDYKYDGLIIYNGFSANHTLEEPINGSYRVKLDKGSYKISIITNEPAACTAMLNSSKTMRDLDEIKIVVPVNEEELALYGEQDFRVRANPDNIAECIVSVGGLDLKDTQLSVKLERLAVKVSLHVTKQTENSNDQFTITDVKVENVPSNGFLRSGHMYNDVLVSSSVLVEPNSFITNGEKQRIFTDLFLPEYNMINDQDTTLATMLTITARYKRNGAENELLVYYKFPLVGFNAETYNLRRNNHYDIHATIKHRGDLDYTPSIGIEVANWEIANSGDLDFGGVAFAHSQSWADGTIQGSLPNEVRVRNNNMATLEFILSIPKGAIWTAHLTNNLDFEFDFSEGGVREGIAADGVVRKIRVKPLKQVSTNNVYTELYITVFNGQNTVELDINDLQMPVEGNRFIIRQIPN
ncbi:MAG: hypothetical protein ACRC13_10490 [Tannerellaceae bacterium]